MVSGTARPWGTSQQFRIHFIDPSFSLKEEKKKLQPREEVQPTAWIVEKMGDDILITLVRILFIQFASVTAAGEVTNVN